MRQIDPALQARLDSGATTLCRCWRVTRADGQVLGFTDHDADVTWQGAVYEAASGFDASGIEAGIGLSVDNSEVIGALSSDGLSAADIAAGRYDDAQVDLWVVDWEDQSLGFQVFTGSMGEISRGTSGFEAELRSVSEDMNRTIGRTYQPRCDAELGDARCGFDAGQVGFTQIFTVDSATDNRVLMLQGGAAFGEGWFLNGHARWDSGANVGLTARIKRDEPSGVGRRVELWLEAPATVGPGDRIELIAGCDGRGATCQQKFGNFLNFRGFPHMPGEDFATTYPSNSGVHNGGSLNNG